MGWQKTKNEDDTRVIHTNSQSTSVCPKTNSKYKYIQRQKVNEFEISIHLSNTDLWLEAQTQGISIFI